jgi:hypothetical protein
MGVATSERVTRFAEVEILDRVIRYRRAEDVDATIVGNSRPDSIWLRCVSSSEGLGVQAISLTILFLK